MLCLKKVCWNVLKFEHCFNVTVCLYPSLILHQTTVFVSFQLHVFSSRSPSEATAAGGWDCKPSHLHVNERADVSTTETLPPSCSWKKHPSQLPSTPTPTPAERWRREMEHHFMLKHKSEALIVTNILSVSSIYMLI